MAESNTEQMQMEIEVLTEKIQQQSLEIKTLQMQSTQTKLLRAKQQQAEHESQIKSTQIKALRERLRESEDKIKHLAKENAWYAKTVDQTLDSVIDSSINDEKESTQQNRRVIDWKDRENWKDIEKRLKNRDNEYILEMIQRGEIDVNYDIDKTSKNRNLLEWSIYHNNITVMKDCLKVGAVITEQAMTDAREGKNYAMIEYLLLTQAGFGTADKIQNDCQFAWIEENILRNFLSQCDNEMKVKIVSIIIQMIYNRKPISSFLIHLAMTVNADKTWDVLKKTMQSIIDDTSDAFGWTYLKTYLINSTFLFRKYKFSKSNDDEKDTGLTRAVSELNHPELLIYAEHSFKDFNKQQQEKNKNGSILSDKDIEKLKIQIVRENTNGEKFWEIQKNYHSMRGFVRSSGVSYHKSIQYSHYKHNSISQWPIPYLIEDEYCLDEIIEIATNESVKEGQKDIGPCLQKWKIDEENWEFLMNFGKINDGAEIQRWRQDTVVNGIKAKYSKEELMKNVRANFDILRFYNFDIYLNELMMQCGVINDSFQCELRSMFHEMIGVHYRRGPLKKMERCRIKAETDYFDQEFPSSACLLDIVRATITFPTMKEMINGIKHFQKCIQSDKYCIKKIMRVKNGFCELNENNIGYADLKFNVLISKKTSLENKKVEIIAEVQFLLSDMMLFKKKSHKYYSVIRKKEYFDVFKSIQQFKNDITNRFFIACSSGDHKQIVQICVDLNIRTLNDLETKNSMLNECLLRIYEGGAIKCLEVLMSFYENKFEFLKMQLEDDAKIGLMSTAMYDGVEMVKYCFSLLENDNQRIELIQLRDNTSYPRKMSTMNWAKTGGEVEKYFTTFGVEIEKW